MKITLAAIKKLAESRPSDPELEDAYLRISIRGGGCSGMSYHMEWDNRAVKMGVDKILFADEFLIVIDPKSALFLEKVELDYSEELNNSGFQWNNPSAKRTCGCGSSFGV